MKNIWAAFILFAIMIIGISFSTNVLNKNCIHLQEMNTSLESYIAKEEYTNAYNLSINYIDQWKKTSKILTVYMHHEDLDHINNELLKLTQYIKIEDKSEALATVHVMKYLLDHIIEHEKVTISNMF